MNGNVLANNHGRTGKRLIFVGIMFNDIAFVSSFFYTKFFETLGNAYSFRRVGSFTPWVMVSFDGTLRLIRRRTSSGAVGGRGMAYRPVKLACQ